MGLSAKALLAAGLGALASLAALVPAAASPGAPAHDDVIVLFREHVDAHRRQQILRQVGGTTRRHFTRLHGSAARLPDPTVRNSLASHPDVLAVVTDRRVEVLGAPTDVGAVSAGQVVPAGVRRIGAAPRKMTLTGAGVGVAIVDTGLDLDHADLQPVAADCFTAFAACQDDEGHGTHVGGIVAARNNAIDVVGVAPGATLYAVKVLAGDGTGTDSTVIAGLEWIAQHADTVTPPIRVVNMSFGRPGTIDDNPALRRAIQDLHALGIAVVAAAGNDPLSEVAQQVPAGYPEVIAVASTTAAGGTNACTLFEGVIAKDTASYFTTDGAFVPDPSGAGGIGVTVSAPGASRENISRNCTVRAVGIQSTRLGGGTIRAAGTSMSAPHVAGVVALMVEHAGGVLAPEEARRRLRAGASGVSVGPFDSPTIFYTFDAEREGVLSAAGALAAP